MAWAETRYPAGVYIINQYGNHDSEYLADDIRYTIGNYESVVVYIEKSLILSTDVYTKVHKIGSDPNKIITAGYNPN